MRLYSKENEGYNYMLTVIDRFSRFAFAKMLKNNLVIKSKMLFNQSLLKEF